MLQIIRDSASTWVVKIVLWGLVVAFVGTIFLVWGYGDETGEAPVAKVDGIVITRAQYQRQYEAMLDRFRQVGGDFTDDIISQLQIEKSAIDSLISQRLVFKAAKDIGFKVSKQELQYEIGHNPDFQINSVFDKRRYFDVLRANSLTPSRYEKTLRRDLLINKITMMVTDSVQITTQEVREDFFQSNEKVNVKHIVLAPALFEMNINVTDEALTGYFDKNFPNFKLPEERKIEYVLIDPETFRNPDAITDDEIKTYYDANLAEFIEKEQWHARHILFTLTDGDTPLKEKELNDKADKLLKEIQAGADFAEMAEKHSEGPTASNGGDLGYFERGKMVPEFEQVVLGMKAGDVTGPIKTRFGIHLIKLEDKKGGGSIPIEEATQKIKDALLEDTGRKQARRTLANVKAEVKRANADWQKIAKDNNLDLDAETITSNKGLPGIAGSTKLTGRAFKMKKGDRAVSMELDNGFYVFHILEIRPSQKPKYEDIRIEVEAAFRRDESKRIAAETASKLLERLRGDSSLEEVASEMGLQVRETGLVKRGDSAGGIPSGYRLVNRAFQLKKSGYDLLGMNGKNYLIYLADKKAPDEADLENEFDAIREKLLSHKRSEAVDMWQNSLRNVAEKQGLIEIEQGFL